MGGIGLPLSGIHVLQWNPPPRLDEFLLKPIAGSRAEQCDPQKHRRVEAVSSAEGEKYLDGILQQLKEEKKFWGAF